MTDSEFWDSIAGWPDNRPPQYQVDALRSYLEQQSDLAEAVRDITAWPPGVSLDELWYRLSTLLEGAVSMFPDKSLPLIDLIESIYALRPEQTAWSEEQKSHFENRDALLYGFQISMMLSETLNNSEMLCMEPQEEPGVDSSSGTSFETAVRQYWDISSFYAQWFKRTGRRALGQYGLTNLREALEYEFSPTEVLSVAQRYDVEAGAAAQWMIVASDAIFDLVGKTETTGMIGSSDDAANGGTPLYRGPSGLNIDRWSFWETRFHQIRQTTGLLAETISHIDQAIVGMQRTNNR